MEQEKDQFDIEKEVLKTRKKRRSESTLKAPLPFRIIAWISLVIVCFGMGYGGTSLALKVLTKKDMVVQEDVVSNSMETADLISKENAQGVAAGIPAKKILFNLYVPSDGGVSSRQVPILSGLMEDDVKKVISSLVTQGASAGYLEKDIEVLHVFRNGEILYLDLNEPFLRSLQKIGKERAAIVMTSIVRTMVDNFSPVTKVRIMIEGRVPVGAGPVDLSVPWQLSSS